MISGALHFYSSEPTGMVDEAEESRRVFSIYKEDRGEVGEGSEKVGVCSYKLVKVTENLSVLYVLDAQDGRLLEKLNVNPNSLQGDQGGQAGCVGRTDQQNQDQLPPRVVKRLFEVIFPHLFDKEEEDEALAPQTSVDFIFSSVDSFKQICSYLGVRDLRNLMSTKRQLRRSYWDNNSFWFGLYIYRFGLTGFGVDQLDWREVYLKKLVQEKKESGFGGLLLGGYF